MLGVGQNIDRYVVEDYAGHGGMAVVYRVRHRDLGTLHALKVLTVGRPTIRDRLLQEGRAQAGLRHPNLVGVTDVIRVDGSMALVMEFVDGPDLGKWLSRYRRASGDECRVLLRGLCDGLGLAHARGIVHRDLKPQNVLLERTPTGFRAKITDFGIAKILEDVAGPRTTKSNVAMGTPHYMAPEQVRDAASADHRADVFALGAILYEAATGVLAFPGSDMLAVLNAVASGSYTPPAEVYPDIDDDLARVIAGCLAREPGARFQSCEEVLGALGVEVLDSARIGRGLDLSAEAWEDAEARKAREEWLSTGPPTVARRVAAPDSTNGDLDGELTDRLPPLTTRDPTIDSGDRPSDVVTVPSPDPRHRAPVAGPPPPAVLLVRRVILSALVGTLLGLVVFLLLVRLTNWPRSILGPPPEAPAPALQELVKPPG